ncbi:MAG: hypothetical protein K8S54_17705 [Spirochaetia bacterium]|nr:hypothetical protein [Spirochaetia bacterium]
MSALAAEEVLLRSGETISGHVTGQSATMVFLSTARGTKNISKLDILRIQYAAFTPAQKALALEVRRQKEAAQALEWERIRRLKEGEDRKQREEQLAAKIRAEKDTAAQAAADRAAALRELVEKGKMAKPGDEPISYWDFAWRSMVLPGWGHFYLDRPWFGAIYAVGATSLLSGAYETHRRGRAAERENHREAQTNFILSAHPGLPGWEARTMYGLYANAKAFTVYRHKVHRYNGALAALGTFYAVQLFHIIYNGIAWEKGLLIVENGQSAPASIDGRVVVMPESADPGRRNGVALAGIFTLRF